MDQGSADFSPDGRWIVYDEINASGTRDVFVGETASGSGRRPVSSSGGSQPLFAKNGREIVYRRGGAVFAASFDPATGEVGTPISLFTGPDGGRSPGVGARGYDVSLDGARFVLSVPVARPGATPNVVVINWFDDLRRKVPQ